MNRKLNQHLKPPIDLRSSAEVGGENYCKINFQALFSILEKSLDDDRIWVSDFQNDEIYVTADLHDVITAYHHFYGEIRKSD